MAEHAGVDAAAWGGGWGVVHPMLRQPCVRNVQKGRLLWSECRMRRAGRLRLPWDA